MKDFLNNPCQEISNCRLCGSDKLHQVLDLGETPPANAFLQYHQTETQEASFPLVVLQCECGCTQLKHDLDPKILFENYLYESSTSPSFVKHFEDYVKHIKEKCGFVKGDIALEIGSNDGIMLRPLSENEFAVFGVEPAANLAEKSKKYAIDVFNVFFSEEIGLEMATAFRPKLIVANNVMAHSPDLEGMVKGVKHLLSKDGWFIFENQALLSLFNGGMFDLWYHEHYFSHGIKSLDQFFKRHGLQIVDVEKINTHGGSFRAYVKHAEGQWTNFSSVQDFIKEEEESGVYSIEGWRKFWLRMEEDKTKILNKINKAKEEGKKICAYSYAAKSTTLCNYYGIGDVFDFVVEDAKSKIHLFTPKFHKEIYAKEKLYEADVAVILAWNFAEVIKKNNPDFKGEWIVPFES